MGGDVGREVNADFPLLPRVPGSSQCLVESSHRRRLSDFVAIIVGTRI